MIRQLLAGILLLIIKEATAAGQTPITSDAVDTQGYQDVVLGAKLGVINATGVVTMKAQQSDDDGVADAYSDIAGSAVTAGATDDGGVLAIEIHRPMKRYVRVVVTRTVADSAVTFIAAALSGASHEPVAQTIIVDSVTLNSPDEGTA